MKEFKAVVIFGPFSSLAGMNEPSSDCTLCVWTASITILISVHPES